MIHSRILALKIIVKHNLFEALTSAGFYIATSVCLLLSHWLAAAFPASVGSSGFAPGKQPLYEIITNALSAVFGSTMVLRTFSTGPFLFILFVAFIPFLIYLAISSLYKSGIEKQSGALELILYGPVDAAAWYLALLFRNIVLTALYLAFFTIYCFIAAAVWNLVPGMMFVYSLVLLFFAAITVYCYTMFVSIIINNMAGEVILFLTGLSACVFMQISTYAQVSGQAGTPAGMLVRVFQWCSPFYYWSQGLDAAGYGKIGYYLLYLFFLFALSCGLLFAGCLVLKVRGVRT